MRPNTKVIAVALSDVAGDALRQLADRARDVDGGNVVALLAGVNAAEGSVTFCCCCGAAAVKRGANAGAIVREAASICGGKGGGRPDMAMAGAKDIAKVDEALRSVNASLDTLLKD